MRAAEAGFTLLEMIAVLVLTGILLAFSPMALDFLVAEKKLESEVSMLATTIDFIKTQAMLDQAPYAMHYDTDKNSWAIQTPDEEVHQPDDPDAEPVTLLVLDEELDPAELDWHQLPDEFTLEFYEGKKALKGRFAVTFDADGTVPPHTLVVESNAVESLNASDRIRTIKVSFSGLVTFAVGRSIDDFKLSEAEIGR